MLAFEGFCYRELVSWTLNDPKQTFLTTLAQNQRTKFWWNPLRVSRKKQQAGKWMSFPKPAFIFWTRCKAHKWRKQAQCLWTDNGSGWRAEWLLRHSWDHIHLGIAANHHHSCSTRYQTPWPNYRMSIKKPRWDSSNSYKQIARHEEQENICTTHKGHYRNMSHQSDSVAFTFTPND